MVARRMWTRQWLHAAIEAGEELVTSLAVMGEIERGEFPGKVDALKLSEVFPVEDITEPVAEIVDAYIARKLMPNDPTGDALHRALACFHRCDFPATWNCQHLANANKFEHIRRINGIPGLMVPALVTPLELINWQQSDMGDVDQAGLRTSPLCCPKCCGQMQVMSFIEPPQADAIEKILKHCGL